MIQSAPASLIQAELKAFVDRVYTLSTSDDLGAFLRDFNTWLRAPGVSNAVSPHTLDGVWKLRMNGAPFFVTAWQKEALLLEINGFKFEF
jgi:hypothetical protein